jgi:hypothetical protein
MPDEDRVPLCGSLIPGRGNRAPENIPPPKRRPPRRQPEIPVPEIPAPEIHAAEILVPAITFLHLSLVSTFLFLFAGDASAAFLRKGCTSFDSQGAFV